MKDVRFSFIMFSACIGAAIGAFIWAFLWLMSVGQSLLFDHLPSAWLFVPICLAGGGIIGLYNTYFHAEPDSLQNVLKAVRKNKTYPDTRFPQRTLGALLPLVFGGSIGPEAGLAGLITSLCFWAGKTFRKFGHHTEELARIGLSAALGVIFQSPLFGFSFELEEGDSAALNKPMRTSAYAAALFGGFGIYSLLNNLAGGGMGFPRLDLQQITSTEYLWVTVMLAVGAFCGLFWNFLEKIMHSFYMGLRQVIKKKWSTVVNAMVSGLILGLFAAVIPYSLFSGEEAIAELSASYSEFSAWMLLLTGFFKLFLTASCIEGGWKGGHFFPVIFSGISIGFGCGLLMGTDPVFTAGVVAASLLGFTMQKPVAVVFLLLLCFPARMIIWLFAGSAFGNLIHAAMNSVINNQKSVDSI